MWTLNLPPTRTSFSAADASQSSAANAHFSICSGRFQYSHTLSLGALTFVLITMEPVAMTHPKFRTLLRMHTNAVSPPAVRRKQQFGQIAVALAVESRQIFYPL